MGYLEPEVKATLDAALARYVAAMNALDEDQFLSGFRSNCVVRDPYGMSLYEGENGLHQLFATLLDTWQAYTLMPGKIYYGGLERIVFTWTAQATAHNGKTASFEGIGVMTLEGDLVDGLEVYWDAPAMFEQIKD